MSLTGLFLILFLTVHLAGNLTIFAGDEGLAFNEYAATMSTNPVIKLVSYLLYISVILHVIYSVTLYFTNRNARGGSYKVIHGNANSSWASRNMILLGILIFAFLFIHLKDFWWQYKYGGGYVFEMDANNHRDIFALVVEQFSTTFALVSYLIGLIALSFHLVHGFQSAFQTLGLEHKRYTPAIKFVGWAYGVLVPIGFATMPIYIYFFFK